MEPDWCFQEPLYVGICSAIRIFVLVTYHNSADNLWEAVNPHTWAQVVQCLSVMSACIPTLKSVPGQR